MTPFRGPLNPRPMAPLTPGQNAATQGTAAAAAVLAGYLMAQYGFDQATAMGLVGFGASALGYLGSRLRRGA